MKIILEYMKDAYDDNDLFRATCVDWCHVHQRECPLFDVSSTSCVLVNDVEQQPFEEPGQRCKRAKRGETSEHIVDEQQSNIEKDKTSLWGFVLGSNCQDALKCGEFIPTRMKWNT